MIRKRVENLPRTGIEYIFTKERPHFITGHKEFERLSEYPAASYLVDEYIKNDIERSNSVIQYPVVYDCLDISPYYTIEDLDD